jgi:hypothetical protein
MSLKGWVSYGNTLRFSIQSSEALSRPITKSRDNILNLRKQHTPSNPRNQDSLNSMSNV